MSDQYATGPSLEERRLVTETAGLLREPARLRILCELRISPRNVTELQERLSLPQPTVSHHLGLLRRGGMLTSRRDGKAIHYALDPRLHTLDGSELHIDGVAGLQVRITR